MVSSDTQPLNALLPIAVRASGRNTLVRAVQPSNAEHSASLAFELVPPIRCTPEGRVIVVSDVQFLKVYSQMVYTPSGMVISFSEVQP